MKEEKNKEAIFQIYILPLWCLSYHGFIKERKKERKKENNK
jgi:hypothetical protein